MKNLTRPKLLIIDEVGYLQLEPPEASLLFQVVSEHYERQGSIVLTSNKAFSGWGEVFAGDAVMASAALNRLLSPGIRMSVPDAPDLSLSKNLLNLRKRQLLIQFNPMLTSEAILISQRSKAFLSDKVW